MRLAADRPVPDTEAGFRWYMKPEPPRRGAKYDAALADLQARGLLVLPTWAIAVDPERWGHDGNYLALREDTKRGVTRWMRSREPQRWSREKAEEHMEDLAGKYPWRDLHVHAVEVGPKQEEAANDDH